ncbi:MAG: tRNA (adenosine(37)-N6)-threonylcarbamoyltransferase complex ATPase subunit type 1 TsaE [Patescibacteria group bacterium]|nr:tRNA (adenosine(37)-N6)-threonylcarbamoyltransferase complex ATPase subunit type 1 TsaE [Patescibacteria group bacterium]
MEQKIITSSQAETQELARKIAQNLKPGSIIALKGDLGTGKTTFTKGIAWGLGIKENINSPTFLIIKEHEIKSKVESPRVKNQNIKLIHIDAYRLKSAKEAKKIGLDEYFSKDNICIIEWPENITGILPKRTKFIALKHLGETKRKIIIK